MRNDHVTGMRGQLGVIHAGRGFNFHRGAKDTQTTRQKTKKTHTTHKSFFRVGRQCLVGSHVRIHALFGAGPWLEKIIIKLYR